MQTEEEGEITSYKQLADQIVAHRLEIHFDIEEGDFVHHEEDHKTSKNFWRNYTTYFNSIVVHSCIIGLNLVMFSDWRIGYFMISVAGGSRMGRATSFFTCEKIWIPLQLKFSVSNDELVLSLAGGFTSEEFIHFPPKIFPLHEEKYRNYFPTWFNYEVSKYLQNLMDDKETKLRLTQRKKRMWKATFCNEVINVIYDWKYPCINNVPISVQLGFRKKDDEFESYLERKFYRQKIRLLLEE